MVIFYKLLTVVDGVALNAGGGMNNAFFPSESATTFRPPTFAAFETEEMHPRLDPGPPRTCGSLPRKVKGPGAVD